MQKLMDHSIAFAMPLGRLSPWFSEAIQSIIDQEVDVPIHLIANALNREELAVLNSFAAKKSSIYVHEYTERLPMVSNWNRMLEVVDCNYLGILHDDDLLETWLVKNLLAAIKNFPDCGIYFSRERIIDGQGHFYNDAKPNSSGAFRVLNYLEILDWAISNKICATAFILDVSKAPSLGCFNEKISYSPDWDLYFKLGATFGACFVEMDGGRYRLDSSSGQLSSNFARSGGSVSAFRAQQISNLEFLGIPPDSQRKKLQIALANQAKTVRSHFGRDLDSCGKLVVRDAIIEGWIAKYADGLFRPFEFRPIRSMVNKVMDHMYPDLRIR